MRTTGHRLSPFLWACAVDVLNEFLNWDSKVFATIALLIVKPWRLTNEFVAGHRVRYVHPLRLYLLASIFFFFAVNYGQEGLTLNPANSVRKIARNSKQI